MNDDVSGAAAAPAAGSRRRHRTAAADGERRRLASAADSPGHWARREQPDPRRGGGRRRWTGLPGLELVLAAAAFAVLCIAVLTVAPELAEPDDYAYRASIVAVTDGHFLTLSTGQVRALAAQLTRSAGPSRRVLTGPGPLGGSIEQWVRLPGGRWISEKNPGYPFLAAPFQALGIIRLAPLFYGALGCLGLFVGARRWLGRFGGTAAVALFCSAGAAFLFAWRDYMATFTEAALIAAGSGALLWAMLAEDASVRRRTATGLLGFLAIEAAVFVRYTNLVLGCALAAVLAARWLRPASVPRGALWWWLGSAVLFGAGVAAFDGAAYGGPFRTGYQPGAIAFSIGAVPANLRLMPGHLIQAMPMLVLGLTAAAWITVRRVRLRQTEDDDGRSARADFGVGTALAASWFSVWGLYAAYAWTTHPGLSSLQTARFYLPATGAIALLGAWLLVRMRRTRSAAGLLPLTATATAAVIVALAGLGLWSFHDMLPAQHSGSPASPHCNIGEAHCPAKPPSHGQSHGSR